jgi:hypothetical protein
VKIAVGAGQVHLTYCLNIHAGETWGEHLQAIRGPACRVRDRLACREPFGLGLRLGARAAAELEHPETLREAAQYLASEGLYAFTINGFPYGTFHGTRVKEKVYAPDWTSPERLEYTLRLARILAALLPAGVPGSISTVPGTYRAWVKPGDVERIIENLATVVAALSRLEDQTGRSICLALEPEPDCLWDRVSQLVALFAADLPRQAVPALARRIGLRPARAEAVLRRHLGVCLDTCHQAVLREDPGAAFRELERHGIAVPKIQVSAAPIFATTPAGLECARTFIDPCYLHQSCLTGADGTLRRFPDLPEAIDAAATLAGAGELRTHFHIPLCVADGPGFRSTRATLDAGFWQQAATGYAPHLEVETYTFGVLPPELRNLPVEESIAAELAWVRRALTTRVTTDGSARTDTTRQ